MIRLSCVFTILAALSAPWLTSCAPDPIPEDVVRAYARTVADGDIEGLKAYLTPDGGDEIDMILQMPEAKEQLAAGRETQRRIWKDLPVHVSPAIVEGLRAKVDFSAEVRGKRISMPIYLHRINGEWKISCHSFSGPHARLFQQKLQAALLPTTQP